LTEGTYLGVWVSDVPLDGNSGAHGDTWLTLDIPETLFTEWEWVEEGKS
jgi:hypothetical protein